MCDWVSGQCLCSDELNAEGKHCTECRVSVCLVPYNGIIFHAKSQVFCCNKHGKNVGTSFEGRFRPCITSLRLSSFWRENSSLYVSKFRILLKFSVNSKLKSDHESCHLLAHSCVVVVSFLCGSDQIMI